MSAVMKWIREHRASTHGISAIVLALATAIVADEKLRNSIIRLFDLHPDVVTILTALCVILVTYRPSSKTDLITRVESVKAQTSAPGQDQK